MSSTAISKSSAEMKGVGVQPEELRLSGSMARRMVCWRLGSMLSQSKTLNEPEGHRDPRCVNDRPSTTSVARVERELQRPALPVPPEENQSRRSQPRPPARGPGRTQPQSQDRPRRPHAHRPLQRIASVLNRASVVPLTRIRPVVNTS